MEVGAAQSGLASGLGHVASHSLEEGLDVLPLECLLGLAEGVGGERPGSRGWPVAFGDVVESDDGVGDEDDESADDVFEFADVARPSVSL